MESASHPKDVKEGDVVQSQGACVIANTNQVHDEEHTALLPDSVVGGQNPSQQDGKYSLIASYALAAWAWRSWEFAVALLLIQLYPSSLRLLSMYGVLDNIFRVGLGSHVGSYVGRHALGTSARNMFLVQNALIGASAASAGALIFTGMQATDNDPVQTRVYWLLISVLVVCGAASSVGSMGVRIAVENRAVKAMFQGSRVALASANAGFRAVDLTCLLAAPIVVGLLMTFVTPLLATCLLAMYTMLAWVPEILLLSQAVRSSLALRELNGPQQHCRVQGVQYPASSAPAPSRSQGAYSLYWKQPVALANLALALLYCSVLSLGFLMTSFLHWSGLTEAEISGYRGIGAFAGIGATALFPSLTSSLGLKGTGLLGILFQLVCLMLGAIPTITAMLSAGHAAAHGLKLGNSLLRLLVCSVGLSRIGLWTFDLAVTQLNQDLVPAQDLGAVCGVQSSIQAACETVSFLIALYLSDPHLFSLLMLGSLCIVSTAALLYVTFFFRRKPLVLLNPDLPHA